MVGAVCFGFRSADLRFLSRLFTRFVNLRTPAAAAFDPAGSFKALVSNLTPVGLFVKRDSAKGANSIVPAVARISVLNSLLGTSRAIAANPPARLVAVPSTPPDGSPST